MKGACDAHFHVFGAADQYPARDPKLRYKPPFAPLEDYVEWAEKNGFERFVFVMSVLEHYSEHECALLLACSPREVRAAQGRAFSKLVRSQLGAIPTGVTPESIQQLAP